MLKRITCIVIVIILGLGSTSGYAQISLTKYYSGFIPLVYIKHDGDGSGLQEKHNVFRGLIESISSSGSEVCPQVYPSLPGTCLTGEFVLKTEEGGKQTVMIANDTRIVIKQGDFMTETATFFDLKVGMKVVVRGVLWHGITPPKIHAREVRVGEDNCSTALFDII